MIEMDVKITASDLYDYMLKHNFSSASGIIGGCFGALFVVAAFMMSKWLYLVLGAIILLYLPWTLLVKSRQQFLRNKSFQKPLHYVLDDQGITLSQGEDSLQYLWSDLYKAVSTSKSIIVYTSRVNATIFPKKQLGEQKDAVIEMISTHMPASRVKIRL